MAQEVEEVIVTANKKAETVQEIPMNISVITESAIEERGITNPEDYLRSIAGVSTPGGSNYYTFRGLNTSTSQRSSGTSSTYIDEVAGSLMGLFEQTFITKCFSLILAFINFIIEPVTSSIYVKSLK